MVLLFILTCSTIQAGEWWNLALLVLLAWLAVQKPNIVATKSCFIIYIKVLNTSCFRKVTFITLWELAKTKISNASSLFLLLIQNFGKVVATHIMVQRFGFGGIQFRVASSAWSIIVLWPGDLG